MNLPKSVNVKGTKYKIVYKSPLDDNSLGLCYKNKKLIEIDNAYSEKEQIICLYHELVHALFNEIAIDQAISYSVEQIVAENIANLFYSIVYKK